jgi:2-amino-4-hydroxy-6-hydroxymethyldihydropteridine diphosphokinase
VPHYHMQARAFVLYPLAELAPGITLADGRKLDDCLPNARSKGWSGCAG